MKLSLELIKEQLKQPENIEFFRSSSSGFSLERPVFFDESVPLKSHTLYICTAKQLDSTESLKKGCSFLCIGTPKKQILDRAGEILVLKASVDRLQLSNEIQELFDRYDNWEKALLSILSSARARGMYQKMLDVSSGIFENGLSIMDNSFRIVFWDETNLKYGGYDEPVTAANNYAIPSETLSYFKYDKDYQRISEMKDIFYYEGEMLPHRVLCKNIFLEEQFLFRIIITECIRPFRKTDEQLLEQFSSFFTQSLYLPTQQNSFLNTSLAGLLSEAIEGGSMNRQAIESELRRLSWNYNDNYRTAVIHVSEDDLMISTLHYYSAELSRLLPRSFAFAFQDSIILVINESRSGPLEQYTETLSVFVRENNFRVGISNYSDDIYKIQIMYRQAETALSIGLVEKPMEWIHWFARYTLQYIFNMLTSNTELGQLYSPIYYRLERYDKENGTSYLETLRIYLECHMNTVQAAKELFIQRSTMIYRLKRIREITDNDLENGDDLLHLYLTFRIISGEKDSPHAR